VIGPQGSGKTLDLLNPALLGAPGAALVTLTKPEDLLLSFPARTAGGRQGVVLDPFGLVPGLPELVWDPVAGWQPPLRTPPPVPIPDGVTSEQLHALAELDEETVARLAELDLDVRDVAEDVHAQSGDVRAES